MINETKLKRILTSFVPYLRENWDDLKYDWEAIQHFQKYWDIDAEDFGAMFMKATERNNGLLVNVFNHPREFVQLIARYERETVRQLFRNLYDENQDLDRRCEDFINAMELLRKKYVAESWSKHYQSVNALSVYLWMRYPDRYYVYQYGHCKIVSEVLETTDCELSSQKSYASMNAGYLLFDEIHQVIQENQTLVWTFKSLCTEECYPDPQLKTLTMEATNYMARFFYNHGQEQSEPDIDVLREIFPAYTRQDFLSEVYMTEERYDLLTGLLKNKKNVILQGAPGVGKTFTAKRLAYSMMGCKDDYRIGFVQFHQSYSYEEFIMGYRPDGAEYKLRNGVFLEFCKKAAADPDREYFFLIDEINRGNMSRIFGELLMLIEKDYRGTPALLAYTGTPFCVPENVYIIGMMNTADRSLAMIDYALRRRFGFFEITPGFDTPGFQEYASGLENSQFQNMVSLVCQLNQEIAADESLGSGFCIGHSYFCGQTGASCTKEWIYSVVEFDLIPMISEYWFDDREKQEHWKTLLRGVCND